MQWFVVKYRKPDGTMAEAEFEAADRSALFEILSQQKISAISVNSGRLGKKSARTPAAKKSSSASPKYVRGAVAGLIVVATAAVLYFVFLRTDGEVATVLKEDREEKSEKREGVRLETRYDQSNKKAIEAVAKAEKLIKEVAAAIDQPQASTTNNVGDVGLDATRRAKELGVTAVDQLLNMATTSPTDIPPPPLPITSQTEDAFREMLKQPIEIKNSDSHDVRAIKERMLKNRAELLALLDEGYTVSDVLRQHQEMLSEQAKVRRSVMEGLKEYEDAGDTEGAELYLKAMNEKLIEIGYEPIYGSSPFKDRQARNRMKHSQEVKQ